MIKCYKPDLGYPIFVWIPHEPSPRILWLKKNKFKHKWIININSLSMWQYSEKRTSHKDNYIKSQRTVFDLSFFAHFCTKRSHQIGLKLTRRRQKVGILSKVIGDSRVNYIKALLEIRSKKKKTDANYI